MKRSTFGFACALAVVVGLATLGTHAAEFNADGTTQEFNPRHWFANSPLGKLITGRIGRMMVLRSELDLSSEQKGEIRKILMSHRQEIAKAFKPVAENRRVLRNAVLSPETDEEAIRKASDDMGDALAGAALQMAKVTKELREVLNEDQRKLIKEFHQENDEAVDKFFEKVISQ